MLSQLLEEACASNTTLLLPTFAADPLNGTRKEHALAFSALFNTSHFRSSLPRCTARLQNTVDARFARCARVVESLPLLPRSAQALLRGWSNERKRDFHARRVRTIRPRLITRYWAGHSRGLLACVYRAVRPSEHVRAIVRALEAQARATVGGRYVAIHMPIERDWWWESDFCKPRADDVQPYARRCFTPREVGRLTSATRERLGASGVLLMYAQDKVGATRRPYAGTPGPVVCAHDFAVGSIATVQKLALPVELEYTVRNAAEQWLAVRAPVAFFGNAHSTFSKGVALMRSTAPRRSAGRSSLSFAYDCVASRAHAVSADRAGEPGGIAPSAARGAEGTASYSAALPPVLEAHPGFAQLAPLPDAHARCNGGEDDWTEEARAERWWQRGEPQL